MNSRRAGTASLVRLLGSWQAERSREPAYFQLAAGLRLLMSDGRLLAGTRLPGERDMAKALGLSRTTIAAALAELRAEGYLVSRHGSGSMTRLPETAAASAAGPHIDFSIAALPAGPAIHRAYVDALAALPEHLRGTGYDSFGTAELRTALAARFTARGLATTPDQIMIVNGALAALALILRLATSPGDRVVIDHPTYPRAVAAIQGASCRPIPVALPPNGWDLHGLSAAIAQTAPRLAYLLPDNHNPTGRCMDGATREALADLAARTRTTIVVDETMAELWYEEPPPPPLAAYDDADHIVTIGSAGKMFWGGLRIGWVRASAQMVAALARIRDTFDLGTPILEQLAVARLLEDADTLLGDRRADLGRRRDALVADGVSLLPDWRFPVATGGLSCWIELPRPVATQLVSRAETVGISIGAGPSFGIDGAFERNVRIPFVKEPAEGRAALERLVPIWREMAGDRSRRDRPSSLV